MVVALVVLRVRKHLPKPHCLPHCVKCVFLLEEGLLLPEESRVESTLQVRVTLACLPLLHADPCETDVTFCNVGMFETSYLHLDIQCLLKKSLPANVISLPAVDHAHVTMGRGHVQGVLADELDLDMERFRVGFQRLLVLPLP